MSHDQPSSIQEIHYVAGRKPDRTGSNRFPNRLKQDFCACAVWYLKFINLSVISLAIKYELISQYIFHLEVASTARITVSSRVFSNFLHRRTSVAYFFAYTVGCALRLPCPVSNRHYRDIRQVAPDTANYSNLLVRSGARSMSALFQ